MILFSFIKRFFGISKPKSNALPAPVKTKHDTTLDFVALDFETASLANESICQVGIAVVRQDKIIHSQSWLVHPHSKYFSSKNTDIHGISYKMVKDSPTFDEIWSEIEPYIKEYGNVAAHYAHFDIPVLLATLKYYNITPPPFSIIDSCVTARYAWPFLSNHRLPTIAEYLKLELNHHNALSDVLICAQALLYAKKQLGEKIIISMKPEWVCDKKIYNSIFFGNKQ